MHISLSLLLIGRYASSVISCKTGHAHLLLQNYFLLKMLFHDQGTYWSLRWPSFSASELDPAECYLWTGLRMMGITSASWQVRGTILQKAWRQPIFRRRNPHTQQIMSVSTQPGKT